MDEGTSKTLLPRRLFSLIVYREHERASQVRERTRCFYINQISSNPIRLANSMGIRIYRYSIYVSSKKLDNVVER